MPPTTPSTTPSTTNALDLRGLLFLPSIILQRGDNDAKSRWGGRVRTGMGGQPVRELQAALARIGVTSAIPDGDFGMKTQDAIKRFQWYLLHVSCRLRVAGGAGALHGTVEPYKKPDGVAVDGFLGLGTLAALVAWRDDGFEATSPLVAYGVGKLSHIRLSATFDVLGYPSPGAGEMLVHQDFVPWVEALDKQAGDKHVTLRVNQAFRVQGLPVSGAVVPPATSSQHLIGHALDVNIVDGNTVNTSDMFLKETATRPARDFVKVAKELGLRWGGDFSPRDPPHFDKRVLHTTDDYLHSFYFAQRSFDRHHAVRRA